MAFIDLIHLLLLVIVPGLLGAAAYNIAAYWRTGIPVTVGLIIDLLTYFTMMVGLYLFEDILTLSDLMVHFDCMHFSIIYTIIATLLSIAYGIGIGLLRRLFFWLRRDR